MIEPQKPRWESARKKIETGCLSYIFGAALITIVLAGAAVAAGEAEGSIHGIAAALCLPAIGYALLEILAEIRSR